MEEEEVTAAATSEEMEADAAEEHSLVVAQPGSEDAAAAAIMSAVFDAAGMATPMAAPAPGFGLNPNLSRLYVTKSSECDSFGTSKQPF